MDKTFFALVLGGVLLNNCALQSFMGVSTLLGAANNTKKAGALGVAVTVVMTISGFLTWLVNDALLAPKGLEYMQTLVFTAVILAVAYVVGAAKSVVKKPLGVLFPLTALNSAVLGVSVTNITEGYTLMQTLVASLSFGLGFLLAMVVFSGVASRIEDQYVPKSFRGLPIRVMAASIVALALYAF
jgi:electron transport complex protein RnfA